ncbi:MAG: 2-keto-4-pentenoate hydratase [Herpetosiphon sp.]
MSNTSISELVSDLLQARQNGQIIEPPSKRVVPFDMQTAYAIGEEIFRQRESEGERIVGRKIGFTNTTVWEKLGLNQPIWAPLYNTTVIDATANAHSISVANLVQPRIEPEIVFGLRSPINHVADSAVAVLEHIDWMALGFEIVQCHYTGWSMIPADGVADFGLHAALIIGDRLPISKLSIAALATQLTECKVVLSSSSNESLAGSGKNVLGNPALALGFLARILATQSGARPLSKNEIITTGTLTDAVPIVANTRWTVRIDGLDLPDLTLMCE